jgi:hypothetical protein
LEVFHWSLGSYFLFVPVHSCPHFQLCSPPFLSELLVHQDDSKAEKSGNNLGDTLFILDLMRQRKEKLMRQKKDEKINEMAMKQKQQKLEARQGMRVLTRPSFGGFVGVGAILANSRCTSPAPRRRTTPKPQEPEVNIPGPDNTEMLIMGILRDKKEEKYHEAHNVRMEQAGVPSDDRYLDKFDH